MQRLQDIRLYRFRDIKVARVAKVAKVANFQTSPFSGYQGSEGCKGCKVSDFIIFRISMSRGLKRLQKLEILRRCHFQDIKVARFAKVADFQTLSFSGY